MNSVGPALLAFLPFALENLRVPPRFVWGTSSAVLLGFIIMQTAWVFSRGAAAFRQSGQPIRPWLVITVNSCGGLAALLQVLNLAGVWFHQELGPYLAGLILLLAIAVVQFCVLILSPLANPPTGA